MQDNSLHIESLSRNLSQIGNILAANIQRIEKIGLLHGHVGVCIFFYRYASYTGIKQYEKNADEMIDFVIDNYMTHIGRDFSDGLFGIGWALKYLRKHHLMELDEQALSDYDALARQPYMDIDLQNDLASDIPVFSKGLYCSDAVDEDLLAILLNDTERIFSVDRFPQLPIVYLSSLAYFLIKCQHQQVEPERCRRLLEKVAQYVNVCLRESSYTPHDLYFLNRIKEEGCIRIPFIPEANYNWMEIFTSWQSCVYGDLLPMGVSLPEIELSAYIRKFNQDIAPDQLSLQGLATLGIHLIEILASRYK